ncbi:(R)-citramalate synthase [Methanococcus maripaludis]|uniref:Putative (R)-citramalate synthase CimA n=5 Tax=Methanococcus maripaludis TaxID=39152 RepID=Q6LYH3_METMP|nr:(R)-citramalate synthase [Methanococcus maripaludis]MDK2929076.1 (R)-citramalate synthase [Methanococcus sp.]AEK20049.1 (R)-citramalate synthase [Methanococcus maripaludis X1]MBA2850579.1 D-citramalate synthase [Methanococcus maripaludis]MBA2858014.1 D-citramalate synthase [Methanococcus maripaludis]MBG0768612.1 2-isopropylmalate synthase [Methanococcus maripaludis]
MVNIFDTTLRDGEQTPGVSLSPSEKLELAIKLDELGVNIIEAGSAITSKGEREAMKLVTGQNLNAEISSFVRALPVDIDAALSCDVDSVHLVVPTSDIHMTYKLRKSREENLKDAMHAVEYAKDHGLIVELSAEDATRSDVEFLKELFLKGEELKADRICVCDTVGILTPLKAIDLIKTMKNTIKIPVSIHCHNDFGMATANTLSAISAGADQCHVTINGIGERAGNASLEEVVMSLKSLYDIETGIDTEKLHKISRIVSKYMKIPVPANKALVGDNAFAHEAGIHVDGLMKSTETYEPIHPETVGNRRKIILGKHSGKAALKYKLEIMNIGLSHEEFEETYSKIKAFGDLGKYISDVDLKTIINQVRGVELERKVILDEITVVSGNKVSPLASINLKFANDCNIKDNVREAAYGLGPVDAAINAVKKALTGVADIELEDYSVRAMTGGTDALIEVVVHLRKGNEVVEVKKAHGDVVMASVEAMMDGINLLI